MNPNPDPICGLKLTSDPRLALHLVPSLALSIQQLGFIPEPDLEQVADEARQALEQVTDEARQALEQVADEARQALDLTLNRSQMRLDRRLT